MQSTLAEIIRIVRACEDQLETIPYRSARWIGQNKRLESQLHVCLLIRRQRESLQRERPLVDHLCCPINVREFQFALVAARLRDHNFSFIPSELRSLRATSTADALSNTSSTLGKRPLRASSRVLEKSRKP